MFETYVLDLKGVPCYFDKENNGEGQNKNVTFRYIGGGEGSRGKSRVRQQLSTPKFGTLYHFTKVSSDDFKVMT